MIQYYCNYRPKEFDYVKIMETGKIKIIKKIIAASKKSEKVKYNSENLGELEKSLAQLATAAQALTTEREAKPELATLSADIAEAQNNLRQTQQFYRDAARARDDIGSGTMNDDEIQDARSIIAEYEECAQECLGETKTLIKYITASAQKLQAKYAGNDKIN